MSDGRPHGNSALIGRAGEVDELRGLLDDYRLITLVGPAGVGKTSLAMHLADESRERFADRVFVAELSGTSDGEDVAGLVARQLGASSLEGFRLRAVSSPTLVVLDNCESAPTASRSIAAELIGGADDVTVVATSRSPLYELGERLVPIRPLVLPEVDATDPPDSPTDAETLFLTRAAEAGATWPHSPANLDAVRRLVRRLDGLPLAIELAAARSRALGPTEMVELLDQRLDLLVRPGTSTERHDSLRTAIASSYEPLSADLQRLLRRLSFLATSFDLRLAHAVGGAAGTELGTLDLLSQLIDASLVEVRDTGTGRTEYLLLDSIRAYGRERLTEADEWHDVGERYADAVTEWAATTVAAALEAFSPAVLGAIRDNVAHLVNAIGWCIDHDPSPARTYQMTLLFFGPTGATAEIAELARRVRATWQDDAPLKAEAYAVMGSLTYRVGRYAEGAELARTAVDDPSATDMARFMGRRTLGYEAAVRRDAEAAVDHIEAAMPLGAAFSAAFDREIRITRAVMEWDPAGSPHALAALDAVIAEATDAGEWLTVSWAQTVAAYHHRLLGDLDASRRLLAGAVDTAERSEMAWASITAHHAMAVLSALDRGWEPAAQHFRRALDEAAAVGDIDSCTIVVRSAAGAAAHLGADAVAETLARTIPTAPGVAVPPSPFETEEQQLRERYEAPTGGAGRRSGAASPRCARRAVGPAGARRTGRRHLRLRRHRRERHPGRVRRRRVRARHCDVRAAPQRRAGGDGTTGVRRARLSRRPTRNRGGQARVARRRVGRPIRVGERVVVAHLRRPQGNRRQRQGPAGHPHRARQGLLVRRRGRRRPSLKPDPLSAGRECSSPTRRPGGPRARAHRGRHRRGSSTCGDG